MMKYNPEQLRIMEDIDLREARIKDLSNYWSELLNELPEEVDNTEYLRAGCGGHPSTEDFIDELEDEHGGDNYENYR